jgi:hypothetical protein
MLRRWGRAAGAPFFIHSNGGMSMTSIAKVSLIVFVFGGAVGGAWWHHARAEHGSKRVVNYEGRQVVTDGRPQLPAPRISAESLLLAQRVAALENAVGERIAEEVAQPNEAAREPPAAAQIEEQYVTRIQQHQRDAVEPAWAEATGASLQADFERGDENSTFTLQSVECRSKSCAVNLEWPTREDALDEWQFALKRPTKVPCGREIVVPEAAGKDGGPARVTLLLDCSTWVASGSPMPEAAPSSG